MRHPALRIAFSGVLAGTVTFVLASTVFGGDGKGLSPLAGAGTAPTQLNVLNRKPTELPVKVGGFRTAIWLARFPHFRFYVARLAPASICLIDVSASGSGYGCTYASRLTEQATASYLVVPHARCVRYLVLVPNGVRTVTFVARLQKSTSVLARSNWASACISGGRYARVRVPDGDVFSLTLRPTRGPR